MRASVVLPLPDSPTIASVSPEASSRLTSSTAVTRARAPIANVPPGAGNVFRRFRASSSGAFIVEDGCIRTQKRFVGRGFTGGGKIQFKAAFSSTGTLARAGFAALIIDAQPRVAVLLDFFRNLFSRPEIRPLTARLKSRPTNT